MHTLTQAARYRSKHSIRRTLRCSLERRFTRLKALVRFESGTRMLCRAMPTLTDTPAAGMTTPLYNSLSPTGQARFPKTLTLTLGGVTAAYVVFGLVPYLYFAGVLVRTWPMCTPSTCTQGIVNGAFVQGDTLSSSVTLVLPRVVVICDTGLLLRRPCDFIPFHVLSCGCHLREGPRAAVPCPRRQRDARHVAPKCLPRGPRCHSAGSVLCRLGTAEQLCGPYWR